jgi:hypothetical protein
MQVILLILCCAVFFALVILFRDSVARVFHKARRRRDR